MERPRNVVKRNIADLRDHPQQAAMFGDASDAELAALAADMKKKKGLDYPVEILPSSNIVVKGHQRIRAAKLLGWTEIDVIERHDLEAAGDAAAEEEFIKDNALRRQLGPLAKARCIRRLLELEMGRSTRSFNDAGREALKKAIAEQFGCSLRTVNRLLRMLYAPPAIQQAVERGDLSMGLANKVALLPSQELRVILRDMEGGKTPAEAVKAYFMQSVRKEDETRRSFNRLIAALRREMPQLAAVGSPGTELEFAL